MAGNNRADRRYDVYGIGNALVDYISFVDDQFLIDKSIGKGIMTLVGTSGHDTLEGLRAHEVKRCSGGSAANTITGLAALGGRGCYSGKVGNDELGRFYREDLTQAGIDFYVEPDTLPTGSCVSFVTPDAERSMLTFLGASTHLTDSDSTLRRLRSRSFSTSKVTSGIRPRLAMRRFGRWTRPNARLFKSPFLSRMPGWWGAFATISYA